MFKRIFPIMLLVLLIMDIVAPVNAATVAQTKSFLQQVQETITSLKNSFNQTEQEFSQGWGELSGDVHKAIQSSIGSLGIPDPILSGQKVNTAVVNQKTDISTVNPQIQGSNAQHEWYQSYSRGQAQSILGREGQKVQSQNAEIANNAVDTSSNTSDQAQNDVITQDILKKMAVQNVQGTTILNSMHQESQQQTRALAAQNLTLSGMSGRMDEQARTTEYENNAMASQVMQSAVFNDAFWENKTQ